MAIRPVTFLAGPSRTTGRWPVAETEDEDTEREGPTMSSNSDSKRIDPEQWYSDTNLLLMLDLQRDAQRGAREAGLLKYTKRGQTFLYKGQWVLDWLNGPTIAEAKGEAAKLQYDRVKRGRGVSTQVATTPSSHSTSAASTHRPGNVSPAQSSISIGGKHPMHSQQDDQVMAEWNHRIRAEMDRNGGSKRNAIRTVVKADPDLQRAFLIASNRHRPGAVRQLGVICPTEEKHSMQTQQDDQQVMNEWNSRIQAAMEQNGGDRRKAIRTVVMADPAIHRQFLIASNRHRPGAVRQLEAL